MVIDEDLIKGELKMKKIDLTNFPPKGVFFKSIIYITIYRIAPYFSKSIQFYNFFGLFFYKELYVYYLS